MNELVRIVADWLEDATYGINTQLDSVPRDNGDDQPADVTIMDETRDPRAGRGRVPDDAAPVVTVSVQGITHLTETLTDDGYLAAEIVVQYAIKNAEAWKAKRDGNYTLRAAAWSLRQLRRQDVGHAGRTRNSITLLTVDPIRFDPWFERVDDTLVVGTLTVPITARDHGI
jgi:hypothetical protein